MNPSEIPEQEVARCWDENANLWADASEVHWRPPRVGCVPRALQQSRFFAFMGDLSGKTVLDTGCGEGYNTRLLARGGARMTGMDISERMIDLARREEQGQPLGIRYELASFSDQGTLQR